MEAGITQTSALLVDFVSFEFHLALEKNWTPLTHHIVTVFISPFAPALTVGGMSSGLHTSALENASTCRDFHFPFPGMKRISCASVPS